MATGNGQLEEEDRRLEKSKRKYREKMGGGDKSTSSTPIRYGCQNAPAATTVPVDSRTRNEHEQRHSPLIIMLSTVDTRCYPLKVIGTMPPYIAKSKALTHQCLGRKSGCIVVLELEERPARNAQSSNRCARCALDEGGEACTENCRWRE